MRYRIVCMLTGIALVVGCAPKATKWTAEAAGYAVYATQIPLYPGAKVEEAMGADSYGDEPESHTERMTWWFDIKDPKDKVVAWYDAHLPDAKKTVDEEGAVVFTLAPKNGEPSEEMGVIVEDGKLRVFETTRPGKHKA